MKNTKFLKLFTTFIALFLLVGTVSNVEAVSENQKSTSTTNTKQQTAAEQTRLSDEKIASLKERAEKEINRRLTSLKNVSTKINSIKKLSEENKKSLDQAINNEIENLEALKLKIESTTDLDTLRQDVKSIKDSYRIYALFIPKIHILAGSDQLAIATDKITEIATKLEQKIQILEQNNSDVSGLKTYLADLKTKNADAIKQYQTIQSSVLTLTPEGYPGNKTTLQEARKMLQLGKQDIQKARQDATSILQGIKDINLAGTSSTRQLEKESSSPSQSSLDNTTVTPGATQTNK